MATEKRSTLNKELLFLIIQFCNDEGYKRTAHMLERESGCSFDMEFFEDMVMNGNWDKVEKYISGFTNVDDNKYSTKIYFEIRKQKFLEALDNNDRAKALDILMKDLKVFAHGNEELYREMTQLLTVDNFREHELLSNFGDVPSVRNIMMGELKKLLEANPAFYEKLKFPSIKAQRLRRLINQGLNWQHIQCKYPQPNPDIETLFEDHVCQWQQDYLFMQSTENPLPSEDASVSIFPASCTSGPSTVTHAVFSEDVYLSCPEALATISNNIGDSPTISPKGLLGVEDEVTSTILHSGQDLSPASSDSDGSPITTVNNAVLQNSDATDLPKSVARILNDVSSPVSMDFHPIQQTYLLVGTCIGDIGLWDVNSGAKKLSKNFIVWNIGACSKIFKAAMMKDPCVSVNRVAWSPDGSFFGVAFSKHIVQLYYYHGGTEVQQKLEIDAHVGGVNDLAFSKPKELLIITGGDDKLIKVWDVISGVQMHNLEGHEAPIYSLCPHSKENIHFIFSTSVDGNIKAWLFDNLGARVNFDAPGLACTTMAYSADNRLFSCGTNKRGESFLVEWNESDGLVKRTYHGLSENSSAVVQFGPIKEKFLAAADDHAIKIWAMDNVELLTIIDAEGDLPANSHIRFNKEGTLLAVIARDNKIKILATDYGLRSLNVPVNDFVNSSSDTSNALREHVLNPSSTRANSNEADGHVPTNCNEGKLKDMKNKIIGKTNNESDICKIVQIDRPSHYQSLQLCARGKADKISRLIYTNAGNALLALASNATHLVWKWTSNDFPGNVTNNQATTDVTPQLWKPRSCSKLMTNDLTGSNSDEAVPCLAVSKNDSYLLSASGGIISLFNMFTFKTITSFMPPSPAATSLAFYPQDNNIIAIGMDDATILIYNVRHSEVKTKLKGHSGKVTGLAFSIALNMLVSSGADAQISTWDIDGWEKCANKLLHLPNERMPVVGSNTQVQFDSDQVNLLVVHETQLSIYEAKELVCLRQWAPEDFTRISQATFSCDCQMIYACFMDGSVFIFGASNLEVKCQILPTAYLLTSASLNVYPNAIAAHPKKSAQFAVGLTDGGVMVFEPKKLGKTWYVDENQSATESSQLEDE